MLKRDLVLSNHKGLAMQIEAKLSVDNSSALQLRSMRLTPQELEEIMRQEQEHLERSNAAAMNAKVNQILGSDYGLDANKLNYFAPNFYSHNVSYDKFGNTIFGSAYNSFLKNGISGFYGDVLNTAGKSSYLDTPIGKMEVFLDLDNMNGKYNAGKISSMGKLINLDVNQDGFLDADDEYFDKLKLKGYNSEGEEVVLKLSDVYNALDLTRFVNTQKDIDAEIAKYGHSKLKNGTSLFRPEESYKRIDEKGIKNLKLFFKNNGIEDGWIDLRESYKDEFGLERFVYADIMESLKFSYKKTGANKRMHLEELRFSIYDGRNETNKATASSHLSDIRNRFNAMYNDYYRQDNKQSMDLNGRVNFREPANKLAIQREFQVVTGTKFSEAKFKEFYQGLNDPKTAEQYAYSLKDTDSVVAMKLHDNGKLSFVFDSGRSVSVDIRDIFVTDGEFNLTEKQQRSSTMSDATSLNEEELNKLDFTQVGVQTDNGIISLADLGIQFIQKDMLANGQTGFTLVKGDGSTLAALDLYRIRSVESMLLFSELSEKDKLRPKFEKEA